VRSFLRVGTAVALVSIPLALGAPGAALAAAPAGPVSFDVLGSKLRQDGELDAADRLEATAAVTHVHAHLSRYDEVEVMWSLASHGRPPSRFVVELVPFGDAPTVAVSVSGGARHAVVSRVASATRFAVHLVAFDANGLAQPEVSGNSVLTQSMVAAAISAAASASKAAAAAEAADRAAMHADARVAHARGQSRIAAVSAARHAHHHADHLRKLAAAATAEAERARARIVHIS
jgi:hypothetical protein